MARTGRPKAPLVLTHAEREQRTRWARRAKSSQALALRARIVLACAEGTPSLEVAGRRGPARPPAVGHPGPGRRRPGRHAGAGPGGRSAPGPGLPGAERGGAAHETA